MYRGLFSWLFAIVVGTALGQPFGNEWIDYSKTYYRFDIATEGVYRIDSAALSNAGIPITTLDPNLIQIYARGEQVPIYLDGAQDGVLNGSDFIEFYANPANGSDDLELWEDPAYQNNPHYNLINDTIRYYLTWDQNSPPQRIQLRDSSDFTGYTLSEYFWYHSIREYASVYQVGERDSQGATSPFMVQGEGYFDSPFQTTGPNVNRQRPVLTRRPYVGAGAPDARVKFIWAGANNAGGGLADHHSVLSYGSPAANVVTDTIFSGYKLIESNFILPNSELGTSTTNFQLEIIHDLPLSNPVYPDKQAISLIEVFYPHQWHFASEDRAHLYIEDQPLDEDTYGNFLAIAGGQPFVYTFGQQMYRIPTTSLAGWKARIPADPNSDTTHAFMFSLGSIENVTVLTPVNGTGTFTDMAQIEEDSALIVVTQSTLMNAALQYAFYREGSITNQYNTVVLDVDELYDQFGRGVPKHPMAIRGMAKYVANEWSSTPRSLFLFGKSIKEVGFTGSDPGIRKTASAYAQSLVPSMGYPSSDPAFVYALTTDSTEIVFPVGRISAKTEQEALEYINKVQTFESNTVPMPWMKNILHFIGGTSTIEQAQLESYMNQYRSIAQDTCFGGNVTTFKKFSSQIIQQLTTDTITDLINNGVSLMTFFAHASGSGFDITIDNPANYDWNGHFPMMIGNSCYTGNIHLTSNASTSEQFVLISNKGAIAFLASVDIGYLSELGDYSREWYKSFSVDNYGRSIGMHSKAAMELQLQNPDPRDFNNALTFTLQGDPTIILNSFPQPEYSIESDEISFSPVDVSTDIDSFQVNVRVVNSGKATNEPVGVALERSVNGAPGLQPINQVFVDQFRFADTVRFTLPVIEQNVGEGNNRFEARVDLDPPLITEQADETNNNIAQKNVQITSTNLLPIHPYEFAIVPQSGPSLKASTGDPFAPARDYYFEIDTTDLFNSPMLETTIINHVGGVIEWQPTSIYSLDLSQDSTVYFWRCAPDSAGNGGFSWKESSFQFIAGKEGWGQAHYYQFKRDQYDQIIYDRPGRDFDFVSGSRLLRVDVVGNSSGLLNNNTEWYIDLERQEYNGCSATPAMHVGVVDPNTFISWGTRADGQNPNNDFGNANDSTACRSRVEKYFIFRGNNLDQLTGFQNMLDNEIPNGHFIVVYTWRYLNRFSMDGLYTPALDAVEALGGSNVRLVPDSVPYILITQKGNPGFAQEAWGNSIGDLITLSVSAPVTGNTGQIAGPVAGPATAWNALYWNERPSDALDSVLISVIGIQANGSENVVATLQGPLDSLPDLENYLDANLYPNARLEGFFVDSNVVAKPSQLERWQLLSTTVPECAIDPSLGYYEELDSLAPGSTASVALAVHNVSSKNMDSLLVAAWVINASGQLVGVHYERHAPLAALGVLYDTIQFSLQQFAGMNTLIVEANPIDSITGFYDQLEQYHFNNIAQIEFNTIADLENPILDVTFDGIHILNGDIVSSQPEILMQLDDENEVLLLDTQADTANFLVFLKSPNMSTPERVYFRQGASTIMEWIPADGPDNISQILYRPELSVDGTYKLIVQATDISDNSSGDRDYEIEFEVIQRPTITDVLNYPNPFTTSTRFVFTVTGTEAPDYMKIQILTISGRVVREITNDELGPLRVGKNMTEFAWDGRDSFGDRLARGVYLYRVIAKLHGEEIEYRESGASPYFKKGIGKMYLLY